MTRSYYSETISNFLQEQSSSILGKLNAAHALQNLNIKQTRAWESQIQILKNSLKEIGFGRIIFEYSIPRMGKRADNIIVLGDHVIVIEFKTAADSYDSGSITQAIDYSLDLLNFHETSHLKKIAPILVVTHAPDEPIVLACDNKLYSPILCNQDNLAKAIHLLKNQNVSTDHLSDWENGKYKPTPTIIEAAQALYNGHSVEDITRYEAGATSLYSTTQTISAIIEDSKKNGTKSIAFVTGVPGAGKTLVGLNIVNERKKVDEGENSVFLSGNGPLVTVLREALARDRKRIADAREERLLMSEACREVKPTIQNVHHFRNDYLKTEEAPDERVAVFDEAQRAWNAHQTTRFVRERNPDFQDFDMSEPHCLIDYMNRIEGWCTIVCLVGGGQEINTGEAGLNEWINTVKNYFPEWKTYYSELIVNSNNYLTETNLLEWTDASGIPKESLHLSVSVRSFRSELLSAFVESMLNLEKVKAQKLYQDIKPNYPIFLTRNRDVYKQWLKKNKRGSERTGVLVSLNAKRLRAEGIDSENALRSQSDSSKIANWFLNDEYDVRSSMSLEIPATEFAVQGLELDWTCVAWGSDLRIHDNEWVCQKFKGTKWNNINSDQTKDYLLNTYRVLLTRARQGMIIYLPQGNKEDKTRLPIRYDETYNYLKSIGINEIKS